MLNSTLKNIRNRCVSYVTLDQESAKRFFKTALGTYGANDRFLGITVPNVRKIAQEYSALDLETIKALLRSDYNEERLLALLILVNQYTKGSALLQKNIYETYLENTQWINNWNLVDSSSYQILGQYLFDKDRTILTNLAMSPLLWERRIAIVATLYFIRNGDISTTIEISKILIHDKHDLIHKAIGWMLREAWKKNPDKIMQFLRDNTREIHNTAFRYATEKLCQTEREKIKQARKESSR